MKPVALVTGASRGIGRAIAEELLQTHVVVGTHRGRDDSTGTTARDGELQLWRSDLRSGAGRNSLVERVREQYGRLDLLVNNAGIAPRERRDVLETTEESFDDVLGANLRGPFFLTQLVARWMAEQGDGRIVFITSISSYAASVNRAEYCIAKSGLSMCVALFATRLAAENIKVFEIRPGIIRTAMIAAVESVYEERIAAGLLPQRRMGRPEDVAQAVRAIAGGLLDYSTGQVLDVDGGFHLRSL